MSKRKHSELEDDFPSGRDESREERANDFRSTRLRHKFERGTQLLFRALKTARGFERQKLGRRQKTAKKDEDSKALERLDGEVRALKALNLEKTAERYLFKQLLKTKRIAESPEFARLKNTVSVSASGPRDPAEANVTARLFKSNPVQNALPDILDGIRSILGLDEIPKNRSVDNKAEKATEKTAQPKPEAHKKRHSNLSDGESMDASRPNYAHSEDVIMDDRSDDESIDLTQFDGRLASASHESDSNADSDPDIGDATNPSARRYDAAADLSISPSVSTSRSSSVSPPPSKVKGRQKLQADAPPKDTTFLPSLMMGGYWSGSESDEDVDTPEPEPRRKNRMGQQARRALWEKKYGSRANHLQNDKKKGKDSKNTGWDMRRGATDENDNKPRWARRGAGHPLDKRGDKHGQNNGTKDGAQRGKQSKANAPLHPSWEAARKAKEQKAQASFQGKKIVFD